MQDFGPIEKGLWQKHLDEFIRDFGEPLREDQALCQHGFRASYDSFIIRQPSRVFWSVWRERWGLWIKAQAQALFRWIRR